MSVQMNFPDEPVVKLPSVDELQKNILALLKIIGDAGLCSGCGAEIWWVVNPKTGKRMPITKAGLNHFADCPQAKNFRKAKQ